MRLKDRFLTHGGLALWSENTSGVDACLFHSAAVPSPPTPLPSLHPPSCTLCPCHSLFLLCSSPFPLRAAGVRGLSDSFHGYWLQRLDTSSQLPVVVGRLDIHSYEVRSIFPLSPSSLLYVFFTSLFHYFTHSVSKLITSPSCGSFFCIHLHPLLLFSLC